MSDDITLLGNDAQRVLNSMAFQKAMDELETGLIELWAAGVFATPEEREDAFNRVRGARMFKDRLQSMVTDMTVSKVRAERSARNRTLSGYSDE